MPDKPQPVNIPADFGRSVNDAVERMTLREVYTIIIVMPLDGASPSMVSNLDPSEIPAILAALAEYAASPATVTDISGDIGKPN